MVATPTDFRNGKGQVMEGTPPVSAENRSPRVPQIRVIGIGRTGCKAVSRIHRAIAPSVQYWCLSADQTYLDSIGPADKMALGRTITRGLGSTGDPEIGRQAADESYDDIRRIVREADLVIIVAGLGGGTGSGAVPRVAKCARESGAHVMAIVALPFTWEAENRKENADVAVQRLQVETNTHVVVSLDKVREQTKAVQDYATWDDCLDQADSIMDNTVTAILEAPDIYMSGKSPLDHATLSVMPQAT